MRLARLSLLLLLVASAAFATAEAPSPDSEAPAKLALPQPGADMLIPDLPSASMYLSWDDFLGILKMLQATQAQAKPAPEPEPPVAWSLVAADYQADATTPGSVRIEAQIQLKMWKKGWIQAPVLGDTAAVESAAVDGKPVALLPKDGWLGVMLDTPGDHEVRLVFHVPCEQTEGVGSFTFRCARTPITRMTLRLDTPDAEISAPAAAEIKSRREENALVADLVFRGGEEIALSWRLPAHALPALPPKEPPRITCQASTLATVTETHLACHTTLQYDILRGETAGFGLALPLGVNLLSIEGNGTEWKASEENAQQKITVGVNHAVADHFSLTLNYELPVPDGAAAVTVPRLDVADVARYSGFIAVATRGNVEIDAGPESEGIQRVDSADLPAALEMQSPEPILHAFRHNEANYLLALTYRRLEEVPVRVAGIEAARITSMITEDGLIVTRASYQVRNNLKKFLRVNLGPGAEVWGAQVGGVPVRPARDNGVSGDKPTPSGTEGEAVLIPLRKSSDAAGGLFPVEIVYARRLDAAALWRGALEAHAPTTDLLTDRLTWDIFLPEDRYVYRAAGDLKPCTAGGPWGIARRVLQSPNGQRQPETIHRLREGIERFYIKDINNPAASTSGTGKPRYDGQQTQEAAGRLVAVAPIDTRVAGVLPIPVNLPLAGIRHSFERMLVPQDTPLAMRIHTIDARVIAAARKAVWILTLMAGCAAGLTLRRLRRGRKTGATQVALLVALTAGVLVAAIAAGAVYKLPGLYAIIAVAVAYADRARRALVGLRRPRTAKDAQEEA